MYFANEEEKKGLMHWGITFPLASPHWVLSGTIPCFIGAYGGGVTHLLNMLEIGVGMCLMLSIFAMH